MAAGTVRVERSLTELSGGGFLFGPPKSAARRRVVVIPAAVRPDLARHLAAFATGGPDDLVFVSPEGSPLRHGNFRRRCWLPLLARTGLAGIHFHDLRHTGSDLSASTGATLRELMDRTGHSSSRAALIYLHGSDARQREIADSVSKMIQSELRSGRRSGRRSGTQRARKIRTRIDGQAVSAQGER